jgi:hypothetical protein
MFYIKILLLVFCIVMAILGWTGLWYTNRFGNGFYWLTLMVILLFLYGWIKIS